MRDGFEIGRELEYWITAGDGSLIWLPDGERIRQAVRHIWEREMAVADHLFVGESGSFRSLESLLLLHQEVYESRTRSWREMPLRLAQWRADGDGDFVSIHISPAELYQELKSLLEVVAGFYHSCGLGEVVWLCSSAAVDQPWRDAVDAMGGHRNDDLPAAGKDLARIRIALPQIADGLVPAGELCLKVSAGRDVWIGSGGERHPALLVYGQAMKSLKNLLQRHLLTQAGVLPFQISPLQFRFLLMNDALQSFVDPFIAVVERMKIRWDVENVTGALGGSIKTAYALHIPVLCVVGPRDVEAGTVAIRRRGTHQAVAMNLETFERFLVRGAR